MFIYSWNFNSEGASNLAKALGAKKIKHEKSAFKGSPKKTVINWGSSELPQEVRASKVLNDPSKVYICSNKLRFFQYISEKKVTIPDWTTDHNVALRWAAEGNIVCARTVLQGHSAEGLVLMDKDNPKDFVKAPLYTKYIPKRDEYRVHVVQGKVIDIQRKALRNGWLEEHGADPNIYKVRNLNNGFVYVRNDVDPPKVVLEEALAAIIAIGLDFGAVDIVYNQKKELAAVLEINTAPGLEGSTIDNYVNALKDL